MEQVAIGRHDRGDGMCSSGSPFGWCNRCSQDMHLPAKGMQVTLHHTISIVLTLLPFHNFGIQTHIRAAWFGTSLAWLSKPCLANAAECNSLIETSENHACTDRPRDKLSWNPNAHLPPIAGSTRQHTRSESMMAMPGWSLCCILQWFVLSRFQTFQQNFNEISWILVISGAAERKIWNFVWQ